MNTFRYEVLVRGIFLYEKKQRNIGQHICQVFKIFSHRLYCRFVPMCGVIGLLCVCVCFGENNSYTGYSGSKYWYFGIKRYVCGIFVCKTMPQLRFDYGIIQRIDFVCLCIDFRLFHRRKCIYRFHCNEVSSDDDWRCVWRCACGKQT